MRKITYIIPIHEFNEKVESLYKRAIESLNSVMHNEENRAIIVGPSEVITKALSVCKPNIDTKTIENENTDMFVQINKAAYQCLTPYFTILEIDDKFTPFWVHNMTEYESIDASIMLPINSLKKDGRFVSFANEIAWSSSFANELGYIDSDCLNKYMDFNVTGGVIKTEDFISLGGLKPSLKIASWYEFLLRAADNEKVIYVVPKLCYEHTIGREDSYSEIMAKEIDDKEGQWLIKTAKEECKYKNDRKPEYGLNSQVND